MTTVPTRIKHNHGFLGGLVIACCLQLLIPVGWGLSAAGDLDYDVPASIDGVETVEQTIDVPEGDVPALINAIIEANESPDEPAVIQITGTYTLSPEADDRIPFDHEGNTGLPAIDSEITIEAAGGEEATIQRDPNLNCELDQTTSDEKFRIIYVDQGAMLTLNSLTVRHGCIDDSDRFFRNAGGIHNEGELHITDSEISSNFSNRYGGGIKNTGVLEITNSAITQNIAESIGAGIYNEDNGHLETSGTHFIDNSASGSGGGIRSDGTMEVAGSEFSNNVADFGGGIFNEGHAEITDTEVANNSGERGGGGIENREGTLNISESTISENFASGDGGGIVNTNSGELLITETTITNNTAEDHGGGIRNFAIIVITASLVTNNTAQDDGGGISDSGDSHTEISESEVTANVAGTGGGISIHMGHMEITGTEISGNSAEQGGGGGITTSSGVRDPVLTIIDSQIFNNSASVGGGGIISRGDLTITESEITNNSAEDGSSGGISHSRGDAEIIESTIAENFASGVGGGIRKGNRGELLISGSQISNNETSSDGGGISNEGDLNIANTVISGNIAEGFGGGILNAVLEASLSIERSTISENEAGVGGGGIDSVGELAVVNSTVFNNHASGNGGGILSDFGETVILATTIAGNSASADGGGLFVSEDFDRVPVRVKNSIIAGSLSGGECSINDEFEAQGDNLSTDDTCPGFTLTNTDPELEPGGPQDNDGPTPTIALLPGSPAIGAVTDCTDLDGDPIETDQRGVARPQGEACDLGAFEVGVLEPGELAVHPDQAGDIGTATVTVFGSDFTSDHSVHLTRGADADIVGSILGVTHEGSRMDVRFNLEGATLGEWDLTVTNSQGVTNTLEDALTIIEGEEPRVWATIQGANQLINGETGTVNVNYGNSGGADVHDVMLYVHLPDDLEYSVNEAELVGSEVEDWVDPDELDPNVLQTLDLHVDIAGENQTVLPLWIYRLPVGAAKTLSLEVTPSSELSRPIEAEIAAVSTLNDFSRTGDFEAAAPPLLDVIWTGILYDAWNIEHGTAALASSSEAVRPQQTASPCTPPPPEDRLEDLLDELEEDRQEFFDTAQELLPSTGDVLLNGALGLGAIAVCAKTLGTACLLAAAAPDALSIKDAYDVVSFDLDDDNGNGNGDEEANPCEESDEDNYNPVVQDDIPPASRTFGHPHFMTFDRMDYDFQAVGEFILTRSTIDETEVQIRLEQFDPQYEDFTIITAGAMNVASDAVVFEENRESFENVPDLRINGASTDLPEMGSEPIALPGGGTITRAGRTFMVEWPDGQTRVDVRQSATVMGMIVEPMLAPMYSANLEGLLGTADGNRATDFQTRDGTILHYPLSFDELYREFGDSWRVTQEESLFGTETFEDLSVPTEHITTADLDPAAVAEAEEICAEYGVQDPILMDNCVFDVAITGDERFAIDTIELITPKAKEQAAETMDENDAKLQVVLETTAENRTFDFGGTGAIGAFTLVEDGDRSTVTHTKAFHPLTAGLYEITLQDAAIDGVELIDIGCVGAESVETDLAAGTAAVDLAAGEAARCTFSILPVELEVSLVRSFEDPTRQESYRLVGLPGQVDVDLAETVTGEPGPDWRAFRESGAEALEEYDASEAFHFRPGKGFWLLAQEDWAFEETVGAVEALTDEPTIELTEGWNILSNPLGGGISWPEVLTLNDLDETLWRWSGSWEEANVLASALDGEAYYFFNEAELNELALTSDGDDDALLAAAAEASEEDPGDETALLELDVYVDDRRASGVTLGLAADEGEKVAHRAPPAHFEAASLRIQDSATDDTYARQVVAGKARTFAIILAGESQTSVAIRSSGANSFGAAGLELPEKGIAYDLSEESTITVTFEKGQENVPIHVQLTAADALEEAIPDELALHPPYPNPTQDEIRIGYDLPEPTEVTIDVFNVLGQRVALLEDRERMAGEHELTWDVSSGAGMLSSGTYFVRLRAEGRRLTEQFVIVR